MKTMTFTSLVMCACICSCSYPDRYRPLLDLRGPHVRGMELFLSAEAILEQDTLRARAYVILDTGRKEEAEAVAWETMDEAVLSIDQQGIVTGLRPGTGSVRACRDGFCAAGSVEVLRRVDYSKIIITEVFYDAAGSDDEREFIEIYNGNDYPCDISGMGIVDGAASSRDFIFPPGSVMGPKSYAVVARSAEGFAALFGRSPDYGDFSFSLNNNGETVLLKSQDGTIIDAVYIKGGTEGFRPPESWGPAALPAATAGQSVYRVDYGSEPAAASWSSGPPGPGLR
ncbi:MAG TPA: lamin tail domain-containing protein [Spirochaetota bacterium]|nr:lamin tail domain-containing protein [Spirochaetota bacterium]HPC41083.1 lamin tail domain-containing protein [Spirochaetota bacterium]HQF08804.1 lamin tail domain-containing protein [Spirochaetota bacterium]HQH97423.1 lamin tail domain-containing protein [Spirochaetota bacterium]HQJ70934.1 lamin tail domain-containing protein [Spirochaetota bacterium]